MREGVREGFIGSRGITKKAKKETQKLKHKKNKISN